MAKFATSFATDAMVEQALRDAGGVFGAQATQQFYRDDPENHAEIEEYLRANHDHLSSPDYDPAEGRVKKRRGPKEFQAIKKKEKEAREASKKAQKTTEKKVVSGKAGTKENVAVDTKVSKQLPLLPQERTSMYNTLNKMSQEQLRKYVSNFNKEAKIVGGHAMKKPDLINAIIAKSKQVESLLAKLRVDVPKIDKSVATKESTGTRVIAKDATGTKTRITTPALVKPGEKKRVYEKVKGKDMYLAGYTGTAKTSRFATLQEAQRACSSSDKCFGITKEVVAGKTYYSTRKSSTPQKKEGSGQESWRKMNKELIKLKDK